MFAVRVSDVNKYYIVNVFFTFVGETINNRLFIRLFEGLSLRAVTLSRLSKLVGTSVLWENLPLVGRTSMVSYRHKDQGNCFNLSF